MAHGALVVCDGAVRDNLVVVYGGGRDNYLGEGIAVAEMTLFRERARGYVESRNKVDLPVMVALNLLKTLDAIGSIRDSDPDAYRAIMREMGDGE